MGNGYSAKPDRFGILLWGLGKLSGWSLISSPEKPSPTLSGINLAEAMHV